jgi:hypothetical protein
MLGRMIDTAMTNDPPFERRPRFIDDAAAADYIFRLQKLGKKAMDAEKHDATYGDAGPTPQQRIAIARLQTRAWQGDPKAQYTLIALKAKAGQPRAQKALAQLKETGQISGSDMGWLSTALKWGTSPVWAPAYGVYKGAQWTGKQLGITSKGGSNPEQQRLAMMRAAAKRRQAAEARAAAADAQSEAEQRAQAAIADAADAEADAADAEALAREQAMKTKEVEADPSQASPSSDEAGWGFHSLTRGLRRGLSKGLHAVESVAKAPFGLLAHFVPGRDARKAALVRNTYKKLWFEHANWLSVQDKNAGRPLQSRAAYEQASKVWAISQLKQNKLPTGLIQDAPTVSAGEAAVRADTLRRAIMGGEIMGSWWWPFGAFLNLSRTTINNTAGQRADAPADEQADQAAPPPYQDISSVPAPQQDDSSDTSGEEANLARRAKAGDARAQIALRKREALESELMGLAPRKSSDDPLSALFG